MVKEGGSEYCPGLRFSPRSLCLRGEFLPAIRLTTETRRTRRTENASNWANTRECLISLVSCILTPGQEGSTKSHLTHEQNQFGSCMFVDRFCVESRLLRIQMPQIRIPNKQLEYVWYGPSPDTPAVTTLVFLHEGLGCVAMWRDF